MSEKILDVPISIQEAILLFDKSKKTVYWAIWRDSIRARKSVNSKNWMLSLASCIALWGQPIMQNLMVDIVSEWENDEKNLSSEG